MRGNRNRRRLAPLAKRMGMKQLMRFSGQRVIFPYYHVISDWHLPHIRHLYRYRRTREFEEDLEVMLQWFEPWSLEAYLSQGGEQQGKPKMVLTFDDGLAESHQVIAPLLRRKGVPAAFMLNNHFIDNRGLFFRYRASLVVDRVISECPVRERLAAFMGIRDEKVPEAILALGPEQGALLDRLAELSGVDENEYMREDPVYLTSDQVKELLGWGFEIGGHSADHTDYSRMGPDEIISAVRYSIGDLQQRFGVKWSYFSFPYSSLGIPERVVRGLLEEEGVSILMGTSGMKNTDIPGFVQRIPMEDAGMSGPDTLKTEYLYYLLKEPVGRNKYRF